MITGWISLISNLILTGMKVAIGLLFNSHALFADGIHNGADVVASIASLGSIRVSNRPADEEHPYGHGKAEVISSGIVSIVLILSACLIMYESVTALFHPALPSHAIAFIGATVSLIWKQILYVYTMRIGQKVNSKGLIATAYDHLSDVYASLATVLGIGLALIGKYMHVQALDYGDAVAGLIVGLLILKLALHMGKEAVDVLMERSVPAERIEALEALMMEIPEVKRIDRLRAREHGHYILVDVRLSVPANLTIQEGHDIIRRIKETIMSAHTDVGEVLVHLNPWYADDEADGGN
jgi:cation diffusion facilitator family transporter